MFVENKSTDLSLLMQAALSHLIGNDVGRQVCLETFETHLFINHLTQFYGNLLKPDGKPDDHKPIEDVDGKKLAKEIHSGLDSMAKDKVLFGSPERLALAKGILKMLPIVSSLPNMFAGKPLSLTTYFELEHVSGMSDLVTFCMHKNGITGYFRTFKIGFC